MLSLIFPEKLDPAPIPAFIKRKDNIVAYIYVGLRSDPDPFNPDTSVKSFPGSGSSVLLGFNHALFA